MLDALEVTIGERVMGLGRKLNKLPQPRARPKEAEPVEEDTVAQVAEPEVEEAQEPEPQTCPKCMKSASESGSPFVEGQGGA